MRKLDVETCTPSTAQNTVPPWILIVSVLLQESIAPLNLVRFIIILSKNCGGEHCCQHSPSPLGPLRAQSWALWSCFLTSPMYHFNANNTPTLLFSFTIEHSGWGACLCMPWRQMDVCPPLRLNKTAFFPHKKFLILTGPLNHCVLKHSARNKGVMLTNSCTWLVKVLILAGPWEEAQRFLPNQKVGIRHDMKKKKKKRLYFGTKRSGFETLYMATGEPCARRRRVMSHECTFKSFLEHIKGTIRYC